MTRMVVFHDLAEAELNEAARYYEQEVTGLGKVFIGEVERVVGQIREHPEAAPAIFKAVRRKLLRRFPFSIMYSVTDTTVSILAVAHHKRRPFYWRNRI